ncbi:FtsX-like permease family protein [Cohnella sp. WQ 127256]|uniref:ABC transporter permease n=1 Tax=Cohnella sp. WQ 127256 TaxID=2938790 RepID=UPI00211947F1|nr:FtsX-like permease family protein [Cohnella sp. WQ 127256]
MFLAWREIKHSKLRYLLIGLIIMLIAWLVFFLSGLANGLSTANGASIQSMKADYVVFDKNSSVSMLRSLLPDSMVDEIKKTPGVKDAAPLGQLTVSIAKVNDEEQVDATILATEPNSFLVPKINEGTSFHNDSNEIILDDSFKSYGYAIGDQLKIIQSDKVLKVVGFVSNQAYNHMPVLFMDIQHWQTLKFPTEQSKSGIENPVSVIAVQKDSDFNKDILNQISNIDVVTKNTALQNLPGYSAESLSVNMMLFFLFIIAAFVLAVFFYVITLQKSNQFGVLKAIGANTAFLSKNLIMQVLIVTAIGILVGVVLTYGIASVIPEKVPFALDNLTVAIYSLLLLVIALLGTILSLGRIAKIDALQAIGRVE